MAVVARVGVMRGGAKPKAGEDAQEEENDDDKEQGENEDEGETEPQEVPAMKRPASKADLKTSSLKRPASSLQRKNSKVAKTAETPGSPEEEIPAPKASSRAPATIVSERKTKNGWKVRGSHPHMAFSYNLENIL